MASTLTPNSEILLLGSTGYTGRLILKYLLAHPNRTSFSLSVAGRSLGRLKSQLEEFQAKDVEAYEVDIMDLVQMKELVKRFRVVITAVGPFWRYGRVVVQACAEEGVHYLDITGETHFIRYCIDKYHYLATTNHTVIMPAAGFDYVFADIVAYLGLSAVKTLLGPDAKAVNSTSAYDVNLKISGGSFATALQDVSGEVPAHIHRFGHGPYALTPMAPRRVPGPRFTYNLPFTSIKGGFWVMSPTARRIVRRTWGLLQDNAVTQQTPNPLPYAEDFDYDEFKETKGGWFSGFLSSFYIFFGFALFKFLPPFQWWVKANFKPGQGPDESVLAAGRLKVTNVTTTAQTPSKAVKTVVKFEGDAGYLLTSYIISEIALTLIEGNLTPIGKEGGVLTAMSAIGEELAVRLKKTGKFDYESSILVINAEGESKKTR